MQSDRRAASDRPSLPETAPNKQEVLQASVNARVQRPAASSEAASRGPDNLDKLKHGEKRRKADAKYIKVRRLEVDSDATKPQRLHHRPPLHHSSGRPHKSGMKTIIKEEEKRPALFQAQIVCSERSHLSSSLRHKLGAPPPSVWHSSGAIMNSSGPSQ